jgi:hypothetical protein
MVIMEKRDFEPLQTIEFNKQLNGAWEKGKWVHNER